MNIMLNQVLWSDAELRRTEVDYGDINLLVLESTGSSKRVICEGYIGYELAGFWDEVVITNAEISSTGPFLDRCLTNLRQRLGSSPPPSGSEARNHGQLLQFVLTFSDGCQLTVAMKGLRVEVTD